MTAMSKVRAWSFAAFVGALALGDWRVAQLAADGEEEKIPAAEVNGVKVRGEVREVKVGDAIERHWVVTLSGDGKGQLDLTCTKTYWNPLSRMMPKPAVLWTKPVAFDTAESRTIDLGKAPKPERTFMFALLLSTPGGIEGFVPQVRLAGFQPSAQEAIDEEQREAEGRNETGAAAPRRDTFFGRAVADLQHRLRSIQ